MCDNFMSIMDQKSGRIVNVGSGGGPAFVNKISDVAVKKQVLRFKAVLKIYDLQLRTKLPLLICNYFFNTLDVLRLHYMG